MAEKLVREGRRVLMHFRLGLESGEVIDSTFEREPGEFIVGDGTLPAGFESCIQGMSEGERKTFRVTPEDAFGMPNPGNVQSFSRKDFPDDIEPTPGMVFSFADASQSELPGVIKSANDEEIVVDFNHPLAGRDVVFEAQIISVSEAEVEEI